MIKIIVLGLMLLSFKGQLFAQEVGANFNHDPEIIDIGYLKKTPVKWIRTTPHIFQYIQGEKDPATSEGLAKIIEAKNAGYKVAFGFRWDFKKLNLNIPMPASPEENRYFAVALKILERVGPCISVFELGNEPNLETKEEDLEVNKEGYVPIVRFTERFLSEVVKPYYHQHPEFKMPAVYTGSLPALFEKKQQQNPGVIGLIKMAQDNKDVDGLSIHIHIRDTTQMEEVFRFVRSLMPQKPIIVTEYSLFRLYNLHTSDAIGDSPKGKIFAKKYGYADSMKTYEWYTHVNTDKVTATEWADFFDSRKWFPHHFMKTFYHYFQKNGVVLATYGYFSQAAPKNVGPETPIWFVNPIFPGKSLIPHPDGSIMENPLWFSDFVDIVTEGNLNSK